MAWVLGRGCELGLQCLEEFGNVEEVAGTIEMKALRVGLREKMGGRKLGTKPKGLCIAEKSFVILTWKSGAVDSSHQENDAFIRIV